MNNVITFVNAGSNMKLGVLKFRPPRSGPTLWEIGIADRSAAEFYVPDPEPRLENKLFLGKTKDKLVLITTNYFFVLKS